MKRAPALAKTPDQALITEAPRNDERILPWIPLLQEKLPILAAVNACKVLYEKYENPFLVFLARSLAKALPVGHPRVDTKWIDEYFDAIEARMLGILFNPSQTGFPQAVAGALGFTLARGGEPLRLRL